MIERLTDWWTGLCLSWRKTMLAIIAGVTLVTASALPAARFDNALEVWFLDHDPALLAHRRLVDTFGSDELIVVGLEAPDVFTPGVLETIDRVTRRIEKAPHVEKVFSLTNIEAITGKDDLLDVGPLVKFPLDPATLPALRKRALANQLYVGNVVSAGGDFACIIARLPHRVDDFNYKIEAVTAIRDIIQSEPDTHFFLAGGPVIDEQFYSLSERDSNITTGVMVLLLLAALWFLLRSAPGVLLPAATVVLATVWAMGWIVLAGARLNVVTTMLPPLLLAVGVADSMHVLVEYGNRCATGEEKIAALRGTFRELMVPLFLTSFTTAIGMLSLAVSRVEGIRQFGVFAALGVAGAFFLSVTLVPIVLSYLPRPSPRRLRTRGLSADTLHRLHAFTMRHRRAIVVGSMLLLAAGAAGATRVRADSVFLNYFKKNQKVRLDTERIEDALSGTITIDVIVDTGREGGVKDPEVLSAMDGLQQFFERQPHVGSAQSVADYFKDMRRAFFDNDQREYRLPATREEAAQYLLLYEMGAPDGDIKEYVTFDYREARVSARVDMSSSRTLEALIHRTERYTATHFPPGVHTEVAGLAELYANMEEYIRDSLLKGFSVALLAIFLVFCVQLRSVSLAAVAMIPNVVPIVLCLGIMGVCGINLDTMTAMVASISIGLAVDDTIHFLSRVRAHVRGGGAMRPALEDATVEVGRAIVYTSLTLSAGFAVMLLASFVGMIYFGLLCTLTIAFALAGDLLLLPVVLYWYAGVRRHEDVFGPAAVQIDPNRPST